VREPRLRSSRIAGLLAACLLAIDSGACSSLPPESTPSETWNTYVNEDYGFSFDYPQEVLLDVQTEGPFQVVVHDDPEAPFYVRATRDYLPNELLYFLEAPSTGATTIGDYQWQVHVLPNGYGDAVGTSPPIYALRMERNSVLYSVVFFEQDSLTELQLRILSTFKVHN
jgi:hypothetical protein